MIFCTVVALICIGSTLGQQDQCVSPNKSVEEKLQINADANDHDNNNVTTGADIAYDLDNNYDTNGDGVVDEAEWIARWTCAYGDTDYFARFAFVMIAEGEAVLSPDNFTGEPFVSGFPRDVFIGVNRQRYDMFQQMNCVNTDLTLPEKMALIMADNNPNNDTVVDYNDIAYDMNLHYDTNNDTKVSLEEWVLRWCCRYGDSAKFARFVWDQLARGSDFIVVSQLNNPPFSTGIPLHDFEQMNRQRYQTFAANNEGGGAPVGK